MFFNHNYADKKKGVANLYVVSIGMGGKFFKRLIPRDNYNDKPSPLEQNVINI